MNVQFPEKASKPLPYNLRLQVSTAVKEPPWVDNTLEELYIFDNRRMSQQEEGARLALCRNFVAGHHCSSGTVELTDVLLFSLSSLSSSTCWMSDANKR